MIVSFVRDIAFMLCSEILHEQSPTKITDENLFIYETNKTQRKTFKQKQHK